ncbi:MAG TPA: type II secretion system F family protein [Thermoanaerobaculia bacterium]|nr:type II secretion system F family protein [Thermoanaerobaculia bacterium]
MEFICRVGTADGRVLREVHEARNEELLRNELERRGLHVFAVERRTRLALPWPGRGGRRRRLPLTTLLIFNQELAALLRAGLPLLQALELMLERLKDPQFRDVLTQVRDRIKTGVELSDAFAAFGDVFPPLYASTLKAGERTGELEQVIRRFVRYLQLVISARKRVVSALVYPMVLVGLSIALIFVMAIFVIPRFTVFYDSLDIELPLLTRITVGTSLFLRGNIWWLALGAAGGTVALRGWARGEQGRLAVDRLRLRVPFLGPVLHRFALSEFCRSLATLLGGGMPLVPSLEIAVGAVGNAWIRRLVRPSVQQVREGRALHQALETSGAFTDMAIDMVKVGEATGALDTMLGNVADFLDEEVETRMQRILALIEPLMLVFMGIIVSLLLVSVYMPLFSVLGKLQ